MKITFAYVVNILSSTFKYKPRILEIFSVKHSVTSKSFAEFPLAITRRAKFGEDQIGKKVSTNIKFSVGCSCKFLECFHS